MSSVALSVFHSKPAYFLGGPIKCKALNSDLSCTPLTYSVSLWNTSQYRRWGRLQLRFNGWSGSSAEHYGATVFRSHILLQNSMGYCFSMRGVHIFSYIWLEYISFSPSLCCLVMQMWALTEEEGSVWERRGERQWVLGWLLCAPAAPVYVEYQILCLISKAHMC